MESRELKNVVLITILIIDIPADSWKVWQLLIKGIVQQKISMFLTLMSLEIQYFPEQYLVFL